METTTTAKVNYASFWSRFGALLIDGIILVIIQYAIYYAIFYTIGFGTTVENALQFYQQMIGFAIGLAYFIPQETGAKQGTLGKQLLNIQVTDLYGDRIKTSTSLIRYLMKNVFSMIPIVYAYAFNIDLQPGSANNNPFAGDAATYYKIMAGFALLSLIAYLMATFTARKQALHDMVAGTVVLKQENSFTTNDDEF